ncbi:MAG TPA: hypothetical protein VGG34_12625 [Opitutaceae bacterium]
MKDWIQTHRRETMDLAALVAALFCSWRLTSDLTLSAAICALVVAALVPLLQIRGAPSPGKELVAAVPRIVASMAATAATLHYFLDRPLDGLWYGALWPGFAFLLRLNRARIASRLRSQSWITSGRNQELLRWALLVTAALWLMRGFDRRSLHGGADALWYSMHLTDTVGQVRAGVFPVFVGQSIYQFNGAFCPVRIAPAFDYLAVLLDTLTLRSLGTFALQNALLVIVGVAAILVAYVCLRALTPQRPWLAAGLAALYLSCPGVIGVSYNTDLYMTWTALPLLPIVWYATVRSFLDKGSLFSMASLGSALGLCWWAHSPTALWSTLFAAAAQIVRLLTQRSIGIRMAPLVAGAAAFGAMACYPIVSTLLYPPEPRHHINLVQDATPNNIVYFLHQVYPDCFLPVSSNGRQPGDFQLGYALWALLVICILSQRTKFRPAAAVLCGWSVILAVLLIPIPGAMTIWSFVPGFVRDVTGNWAPSRLYLLLGTSAVFSVATCVAYGIFASEFARRALAAIVAAGCIWSFSEAAKFGNGSSMSIQPPGSDVDLVRPENVQLSRYSYSLEPDFPAHPDTFTHGVTDPDLENRILSSDMSTEVLTNLHKASEWAHLEGTYPMRWDWVRPGAHAETSRPITIAPGKSYLFRFNFGSLPEAHGVLKIYGPHLNRIYGLPDYGGTRAFGAGGQHSNEAPIWTTTGSPEDLNITFSPIPEPPLGDQAPIFAQVQVLSYDKNALPIRVTSWTPYRASVRSPAAGWLETPRIYQTGYRATVGGEPAEVRKSPESLVAVRIPAGGSQVDLLYAAPAGLAASFWVSLLSAAAAAVLGCRRMILHLLGLRYPAKASGPSIVA